MLNVYEVCLYRLRNITAPAYADDTLESPHVINPRKGCSCFTFRINHQEKSRESQALLVLLFTD